MPQAPQCLALGLLFLSPALLAAQQPTQADTTQVARDSTGKPINLQEITVTAAPARREDPASVVHLTPAVLQRAPAIDPYELLRQTAGLEVHDQGQGPGFASDASVRGFSSDHSTDLALWIDGVPVNEPVNGHAEGYNDWNVLFPASVQTVDIFKGPTSPLYGNFALAGAVNVRTLERMRGTRLLASGGAYGRLDGTVLTGFDDDNAGGVFGIRGLREDGWRPNSGYQLGQAHARVVRDLSSSVSVDGGVELYAAGWDSPGFLTLNQFQREKFDTVSNSTDGGFKRRAQERASIRVVSGGGLVWRSTVYATQGRWQLYLTTPPEGGGAEGSGSQTEEEDHRYGFGATSALTWAAGRTEFTLGAETRWDHSHYENWFVTNRVRDSAQTLVVARQESAALFLQSAARLAPRLRVTVGGRFDVADTHDEPAGEAAASDSKNIFSPKLGAVYRVGPEAGVDLYANVSRGFRQTDGVIEDPTLPFITAWAYESGIRLNGRRVRASAAVFRMDVSNEQTFNPVTLSSTSGGQSRRQGVELELDASLGAGVVLEADWTFNDAKYRRLITEDGDTLSGTRVFNTARYVGSAALRYRPATAHWDLNLSTNVVGPYTPFDEPGVELSPYALLHLMGEYQIGRATLSVGIRNLFDRVYPELRAGGFVVPGQPRSVYGMFRLGLASGGS
jgi:outer membrane receptor protein involved in Fe transport